MLMRRLLVFSFLLAIVMSALQVPAAHAQSSSPASPPVFVGAVRTSPDTVDSGDTISIDWSVKDAPVTDVEFEFRGTWASILVKWQGAASTSGTATAKFEKWEASSDLKLMNVTFVGPTGRVDYFEDGTIFVNNAADTSGLQWPDVRETLNFHFANSDTGPFTPWFIDAHLTSPATVGPDEPIAVNWEVRDLPVEEVVFIFEGENSTVAAVASRSRTAAFSGVATGKIDRWQYSSDLKLVSMRFASPRGGLAFVNDGGVWKTYGANTEGQEWPDSREAMAFRFSNPLVPPRSVTPLPVAFNNPEGTVYDTFTVPRVAGIEYLRAGNVISAGVHPGQGTVAINARAKFGFKIPSDAVQSWTLTFTADPIPVTPGAVTFADKDGTKDDVYVVPATAGVEYLVGGKVVAAGTYPGTGTVTVTARAKTDYVLAAGAVASWTATFKSTMPVLFTDVPAGAQFQSEISWLAAQGISTGWVETNGSRTFRPLQAVNRDAMAAFMYRLAGSPAFQAPAVSPFADVTPSTQFYKEITWLASEGISTGWVEANGTKTFRPVQPVNRDAMAAFMYRFAGKPVITGKATFADVPAGAQFQQEISWLAGSGISTGWTEANGSKTYRPLQPVNRDAMAAFMYRYHQKFSK
jgi:hypothetical protein